MAEEIIKYVVVPLDFVPPASQKEIYDAFLHKVLEFLRKEYPNDHQVYQGFKASLSHDVLYQHDYEAWINQLHASINQNGKQGISGCSKRPDFPRLEIIVPLVIEFTTSTVVDTERQEVEKVQLQEEGKKKLAKLLKGFLDPYVEGDEKGFSDRATSEAKLLSEVFGVEILHTIGNIYKPRNSQELGQKTNEDAREKTAQKDGKKTVTDTWKKTTHAKPNDTGAKWPWKLNVGEIENTFSDAWQMVLSDQEDAEKNPKYPEALEKCGKILQQVSQSKDASKGVSFLLRYFQKFLEYGFDPNKY